MIPYCFVCPLSTVTCGNVKHVSGNSFQIITLLQAYVNLFPEGAYDMKKVREFGLLTRK